MTLDLIVRGASEVLTCGGDLLGPTESALARLVAGVVGVEKGRIAYLGPAAGLPKDAVGPSTELIDAAGGFVGPGFVDAHTHAVFAGERSGEFAERCAGASYTSIAAAGGGIARTVRDTRAASEEGLIEAARSRLRRLLTFGVTTAEVKSGYGLSLAQETKVLRAAARLGREQPVTLVLTLLCAHAIPEEYKSDRRRYVELCTQEIVPRVAEEGLARFCDVFVEEGAFQVDEARVILEAARRAGLGLKVHAEQLSASGGAALAAELHASSADHLECLDADGIQRLAQTGVVATLLPTSTLFLRLPRYAPGRALRDAGVVLALGTNLNPGSAMSENVALTLGLACLGNGLTPGEAYLAATRGSAQALGLAEAGRLQVGGPADLVVFSCSSFQELPYHLGMNQVRFVLKDGRRVVG